MHNDRRKSCPGPWVGARLWLLGRKEGKAGSRYPFSIEVAARFLPGVRRVALVPSTDNPVLAVEGDEACFKQWTRLAEEYGDIRVRLVSRIPLDRRHRSKVDYGALRLFVGKERA